MIGPAGVITIVAILLYGSMFGLFALFKGEILEGVLTLFILWTVTLSPFIYRVVLMWKEKNGKK